MKIPAHVRTIGALVHWIADTYHDGAVYPIAARTRLSPGILARWAGDSVKTPRLDSVVRFADAYQLNSQDVLTLVYRSLELDLARQRKLITNEIKRRRPRGPIAGGSGTALPLPDAGTPNNSPSYRKFGRHAAGADKIRNFRNPIARPRAA